MFGNSTLRLKNFSQMEHLNGFSPECTTRWWYRMELDDENTWETKNIKYEYCILNIRRTQSTYYLEGPGSHAYLSSPFPKPHHS